MSFVNRPMHIIRGLSKAVKGLKDKVLSLATAKKNAEQTEHNEQRGNGHSWGSTRSCRNSFSWIKMNKARKKKARKVAHNSKIVNAGGKKRV